MVGIHPDTTLPLAYKPDASDAQARMRAYWSGEMIDRPCLRVVTPKEGRTPSRRSSIVAPDFDFRLAVSDFMEWASSMFFGGEAMPALVPFYGPDQFAAFFGARMTLAPEMDTSWVEPIIEDWSDAESLKIHEDNPWWKAILDLVHTAAECAEGRFIVAGLDTHSNLDCISSLRGPERLCVDLIESPDNVLRAVAQVDAVYESVYTALYEAGSMAASGTTCWVDMWSPGKTNAVQCDFSYMVSPEHFRRFILPSIEYECSTLDHAVFHIDGVSAFKHLDDLLAIRELHTVQVVPGAGQPTAPAWIDLLRKIQQAGKGVQIFVTPDELKVIHSELEPQKTFYWVVDCEDEIEARELINWLETHT